MVCSSHALIRSTGGEFNFDELLNIDMQVQMLVQQNVYMLPTSNVWSLGPMIFVSLLVSSCYISCLLLYIFLLVTVF
jgi:hypothetical protein